MIDPFGSKPREAYVTSFRFRQPSTANLRNGIDNARFLGIAALLDL